MLPVIRAIVRYSPSISGRLARHLIILEGLNVDFKLKPLIGSSATDRRLSL